MAKCTGKLASTATIGLLLVILPVISLLLNPMRLIVNYATRVNKGSFMLETFQKEVEGAHLSLYVFNITNSDRFMTGQDDKLKVEEIGPFTYAEIRHNVDVDLNEEEGVMWFTPQMKLRFVPEKSISKPEFLNITVPNLALLSATSLISQYPSLIREGYNLFVRHLKSQPVISLDVHSYLWGYPDPLIAMAQKLVPGLINFDSFGIADRLYENSTMYRMKVGIRDEDRFSVKELKKFRRKDYNNTDVEPLESIYRLGVCRTFDLVFQETKTMEYGFDAWKYRINNATFTRDCSRGFCGMMDLSKCTLGIPIGMSKAHFLHADPAIYHRVEGMKPNAEAHDSYFLVEPTVGITLSAALALQMNVNLGNITFNEATASFSNMVVPVVYIKVIQQDCFETIKDILRIIHITGPTVLLVLEIILFIVGIGLLAYSVVIYKKSCAHHKKKCLKEKQTAPLITYLKN
ncbi:scavenger receptor class B member 1 [Manduca sexta]|uniref:scavenger receptor class B member 1 n=1 Tax=Manduca sexta TaxID=7130 RepID=UPI0018902BFD|nr:scavenger receptor class B member 1 [Manduca sexta]